MHASSQLNRFNSITTNPSINANRKTPTRYNQPKNDSFIVKEQNLDTNSYEDKHNASIRVLNMKKSMPRIKERTDTKEILKRKRNLSSAIYQTSQPQQSVINVNRLSESLKQKNEGRNIASTVLKSSHTRKRSDYQDTAHSTSLLLDPYSKSKTPFRSIKKEIKNQIHERQNVSIGADTSIIESLTSNHNYYTDSKLSFSKKKKRMRQQTATHIRNVSIMSNNFQQEGEEESVYQSKFTRNENESFFIKNSTHDSSVLSMKIEEIKREIDKKYNEKDPSIIISAA